MPERGGDEAGFTLLEVMLAIVVLGLVMGQLIASVTQNLDRLGEARRELRALLLAEERMRDLEHDARGGTLPELGRTSGSFEAPDDDLAWELEVEGWNVPFPRNPARPNSPGGIFAGGPPRPPNQAPTLVRALLRVHALEEDPEGVEPLIALLAAPPTLGQPGQPGQPGPQGGP
jgi:prepilin-type N-terminal cleavage/methylation domain-containing protein